VESGIPPFVGPQWRVRYLTSVYGFANHLPVEVAKILKRGPEVAGVPEPVKIDTAPPRPGVNSHKDEASGSVEEQIREHPSGFPAVYATHPQRLFCPPRTDTRGRNVRVLRLDVHSDVDFHSTGVAPAWSKKRNVERKVGATGMTGHELGRMRKEAHFKGTCQPSTWSYGMSKEIPDQTQVRLQV
jgi:hypothetical protein